jgi:3-dehydrosphinganine reductase
MWFLLAIVSVGLLAFIVLFVAFRWRPPRFQLKDAHVFITGGSSGIGKALAIKTAQMGCRLTLVARDMKKLEDTKSEIEALTKVQVQIISVDVSGSFEDVEKAMKKAVELQGPVDVLVNSAGTASAAPFEETQPEEFERLMRINYLGSVYTTKCVVQSMKDRKTGRIVFVSSQAGQVGIYGFTAYSPSKCALRGLAEALQMELLPYNVYVAVSFPPDTDTPGLRKENENKPEITKLISDTSGLFDAETVAGGILEGLQRGDHHIWVGLDGFMLAQLTAGMSPVHHLGTALLQVFTMSLFRLISFVYLASFNKTVQQQKIKAD